MGMNHVEEFQIKKNLLSKFPLLAPLLSDIEIVSSNENNSNVDIDTACTDGKKIYYNKEFVDSLEFNEKLGVFAHETLHIAFNHVGKIKNKDLYLWNYATDAVVNQILIKNGLSIGENAVFEPDALNMSADEYYLKLLKEKQQNNEQGKNDTDDNNDKTNNNQQNSSKNSQTQTNNSSNEKKFGSHKIWKKVLENNKNNDDLNNTIKNNDSDLKNKDGKAEIDEHNFLDDNNKSKENLAERIKQNLKSKNENTSNNHSKNAGSSNTDENYSFNEITDEKSKVDWKNVIRKNIDDVYDKWSYRRSCEDNYYSARIESINTDDGVTEVMLDTSSSVEDDMLKSFLMQLKSVIRETKLKVGCFSDRAYDFVNINSNNDINDFIVRGRGGTNFDSAVNSFSKNKDVMKIIFTDGEGVVTPRSDLKHSNFLWIVYDNDHFECDFGKVIRVNSNDLVSNCDNENEIQDYIID